MNVGRGICLLAVILVGCAPDGVDGTYGKRRGTRGGASVNGTAVLAGMFEETGRRVSTWRRLSPKLEQCQTIIWFPDSFDPPTREQREFLEDWLSNQPGRTLVYVGRDYDAAITYWQTVQPLAPPDQAVEVARRLATAQAEHDFARARMPQEEHVDWFTLQRDAPFRRVHELSGEWSEGIDPSKVDIAIAARLNIPSEEQSQKWSEQAYNLWSGTPEFLPLLKTRDDVLVSSLTLEDWPGGKIILVNNGSFLTNLPLVNHEHRKLAGKLISACGPGRVVFLESSAGGPGVFAEEPGSSMPSGFGAFTVWPLGFILMHLAALGILCCIALFPIFGRPREAKLTDAAGIMVPSQTGAATVVRANFGKHIEALGELLATTQDRHYAQAKVAYYHEHVKRDSGVSHRQA